MISRRASLIRQSGSICWARFTTNGMSGQHRSWKGLDEDCTSSGGRAGKGGEALEVVRALRNDQINPALRLAEALVELHGHQQQGGQFAKALDSSLMPNRPNGIAFKRRVSRSEAGTRKAVDLRSIVLSHALLDFLVHRHLRKDGEGKAARPLTLRRFLDILRDHYGLHVDREPPGMSVPRICCAPTSSGWNVACATSGCWWG
jgi:hypothetical protein